MEEEGRDDERVEKEGRLAERARWGRQWMKRRHNNATKTGINWAVENVKLMHCYQMGHTFRGQQEDVTIRP